MKRNYFLMLIISMLMSLGAYSTTYTSVQNGNWMNVTTWSPFGVPLPGDIVIIDHNVILDTSFAYTVGSISVNAGASLINDSFGRDIWLNGVNASFTNDGTTTIDNLLLSAGSYSNSGDFNVKVVANYIMLNNGPTGIVNGVDSMYNDGTVINNGIINIMTFFNNNTINNRGTIQGLVTVVDSMYNAGTFMNDAAALLKADSCTNSGMFTNNGTIEYYQYTNLGTFINNSSLSFDDITNLGTFTNNGNMVGANSMWNVEDFDNTSSGQITLATSFLNADSLANTATFNNDGAFDIGDSFYNFNDITGGSTGSFTMQDTSYNSGTMTGSFDFCDATPPGASPFLDINLGTVDPLITYCTATGIKSTNISRLIVYPNPTNGIVKLGDQHQFIEVYTVNGEKVMDKYSNQVNLEQFKSGIYFLIIKDKEGNQLLKEKLIKD